MDRGLQLVLAATAAALLLILLALFYIFPAERFTNIFFYLLILPMVGQVAVFLTHTVAYGLEQDTVGNLTFVEVLQRWLAEGERIERVIAVKRADLKRQEEATAILDPGGRKAKAAFKRRWRARLGLRPRPDLD